MSQSDGSKHNFSSPSPNFYSSDETEVGFGCHNHSESHPEPWQSTPPYGVNLWGIFEQYPWHSTVDSYGRGNTSYSQFNTMSWNNINPGPVESGGTSKCQFPDYWTAIEQAASPSQPITVTPSPASLDPQGHSPSQAAGYAICQTGRHFSPYPNLQQPSLCHEQQQASSLQGQEFYYNPHTSQFPPPDQLTHGEGKRNNETPYPRPGPYVCESYGVRFGRPTDLFRHPKGAHRGPVGPKRDRRFKGRFTRAHNFKTHYKTEHGKTELTHRNGKRDNETPYPSPGAYVSESCGVRFLRQTDPDKHQTRAPGGPACPERDCRFKGRFTRVDNFKIHYEKQHGKNGDEVGRVIQGWRVQRRP